MMDKLQSDRSKRLYIITIISLLCSLFLIQYFFLPYLFNKPIVINGDTLITITDKLFISILVTCSISFFIFWVSPSNKKNAQIKILQPMEISDSLIEARLNSEKWWYSGSTGRYSRNITLPYFAKACRSKNYSAEITIMILNPQNKFICNKYANYRKGLRTSNNNRIHTNKTMGDSLSDVKMVRLELLSTIISAFIWKTEQPLLKIKIALKDHFSLFRIDLSTTKAVLTKEDPIEPAILFEQGSFFYNAYLQDLIQGFDQSRQLDMAKEFVTEELVTPERIKALLNELVLDDEIDDNDIVKIQYIIKNKSNPYC